MGRPRNWASVATDTDRDQKRDMSSPGAPKADSAGKGTGEQGAVGASWDPISTPDSG